VIQERPIYPRKVMELDNGDVQARDVTHRNKITPEQRTVNQL